MLVDMILVKSWIGPIPELDMIWAEESDKTVGCLQKEVDSRRFPMTR